LLASYKLPLKALIVIGSQKIKQSLKSAYEIHLVTGAIRSSVGIPTAALELFFYLHDIYKYLCIFAIVNYPSSTAVQAFKAGNLLSAQGNWALYLKTRKINPD